VIAQTLLSITHRQMAMGVDLSLQTYPALTYTLPARDLLAISRYRAKMILFRVGGRVGDPARCGASRRGFRRLKVAMVSSDYGEHLVAYALNEVVCQRNQARMEHHLYALTNTGYYSDNYHIWSLHPRFYSLTLWFDGGGGTMESALRSAASSVSALTPFRI